MRDDAGPELSVDEFVEYCHTQAGLLSGRAETMQEEVDDTLAEIESEIATIRERLEAHTDDREGPTAGPDVTDLDVAEIEDLESEVETKQALVEATQARLQAFQELAGEYADLGVELQSEVEDGQEAMNRVLRFEVDHDAPAYFQGQERQTLAEVAAESSNDEE